VKLKVGRGALFYACGARNRGTPRGENGSNIEEKKMSRLREKTTATLLIAAFMISAMTFVVSAKPKNDYKTITEGEIFYSAGHYLAGQPIPTGFDPFGYNYQGHMFKGS